MMYEGTDDKTQNIIWWLKDLPIYHIWTIIQIVNYVCSVTLGTIPGGLVLSCLAFMSGWTVFAYYTSMGCDPLRAGYVSNPNQVPTYYNYGWGLGMVHYLYLGGCVEECSSFFIFAHWNHIFSSVLS